MKKITFIRHSQLKAPYNDYSKLTFSQISDLATGVISPDINSNTKNILLKEHRIEKLQEYEYVFCSLSKRTEQTASLIRNVANSNFQIHKTDMISEIYFDPKILMTEKDYKGAGMTAVRSSLFKGMKNGNGAESFENVFKRIILLKNTIEKVPYNNVLCITHSFYMRFLHQFFMENVTEASILDENTIMNTIDYHYLQGFEVTF